MTDETAALLRRTADLAVAYLESLPERPVGGEVDVESLRQELVKPLPDAGEDPAAVIEELADVRRVQEDGTLWLSGTTWHGMAAMRIRVSNWSTTDGDADRSVQAILRCARAEAAPVNSRRAATVGSGSNPTRPAR
jgi:hypothetical protein